MDVINKIITDIEWDLIIFISGAAILIPLILFIFVYIFKVYIESVVEESSKEFKEIIRLMKAKTEELEIYD